MGSRGVADGVDALAVQGGDLGGGEGQAERQEGVVLADKSAGAQRQGLGGVAAPGDA